MRFLKSSFPLWNKLKRNELLLSRQQEIPKKGHHQSTINDWLYSRNNTPNTNNRGEQDLSSNILPVEEEKGEKEEKEEEEEEEEEVEVVVVGCGCV